jgi:hypothetical protein
MAHRIRLVFDSLNHTWNSAVITYDFERQLDIARSAGTRLQGIQVKSALMSALKYLLAALAAAGAYLILFYRKRLFPSREERLLRSFYRTVERDCSVTVERGRVGLFELADRTGNPGVRLFAEIYAGAVYRDRKLTDDEFVRLKRILEQIQKTS